MNGRTDRRHRVVAGDPVEVLDLLRRIAPLGDDALREVLDKGGVWLTRGRGRDAGKSVRVRDGDARVRPGDRIDLHHDPRVLATVGPEPVVLDDRGTWSAWFKPAGLLTQGTRYGDHASLLRRVEGARRGPVHPIHRLDRETPGVAVVGHERRAAARLSEQFRRGRAIKEYRAIVVGDLGGILGTDGVIARPLDGRRARTRCSVVRYDPSRGRSLVDLRLDTGRTHQIRRHLDAVAHPVVGDPRYGSGNKDPGGLRLAAVALTVTDPESGEPARFTIPDGAVPWLTDGT